MTIVVCPKCKGEGTVEVFAYQNHSEGTVYNTEPCPLCKGDRVVYEIIRIEHKPINHDNRNNR